MIHRPQMIPKIHPTALLFTGLLAVEDRSRPILWIICVGEVGVLAGGNKSAIYKRGRGFELGMTENKSSKWSERDSNPGPSDCESTR